MTDLAQQSNPFSTGGGGPNFETRVQAAFTVLMLANQPAPCLPAFPITKLKLQGQYDGFSTDDFIAFAQNYQTGEQARLMAQIKHDVAITEGNDTFSKVIASAWDDFNDEFVVGRDAFALITGPLSSVDINHVRPILEWARCSENEVEFFQKLNTEGFSSHKKQEKLQAFKTQLKKANDNKDVADQQIWAFLKSFHLIGYDFDTTAGNNLSLIKAFISQCTNQPAESVWGQLLDAVQTANQNAGTISLDTLGHDIKQAFDAVNSHGWLEDRRKLNEHGDVVLRRIRNTIGGVHIEQTELLAALLNKAESSNFVIVTGERGSGKSSLVQKLVEEISGNIPVFCFSTEDFNTSNLDHVFSSMNLQGSLNELAARLALIPRKYLVLESLEKLLELEQTTAFTDLLQFIKKSGDWKIIASCRDYAIQQVIFHHLSIHSISYEMLHLHGFNDEQLQKLCEIQPSLAPLINNPNLKLLLRIPFFAELAHRVLETGQEFPNEAGEKEFRRAVWSGVIAKEQDRRDGMPTKRKRTFVDIAVQRAKQMVYGVPENCFDCDAVYKLEEDNIIYRDPKRNLLVPAHDVLEDWAIANYVEAAYQRCVDDVNQFIEDVGSEPAITRSYRLWLHQKLSDQDDIDNFVYEILTDKNIPNYWKDETISAILDSDYPDRFLNSLASRLFENDFELLKRFCFVLRVACQVPLTGNNGVNALFLIPHGKGWGSIIHFLHEHKEQLAKEITPHIAKLLNNWSSILHINKHLFEEARDAGLLALHLLEPLKETYKDNEERDRKTLLRIIIKTASAMQNEFIELIERDVFVARSGRRRPERPHYVDSFCELAFSYIESAYFSKNFPDLMIRLANYEWFVPEETYFERDPFRRYDGGTGVAKFFQLHEHKHKFFPASGLKGSFHHLLNHHPIKGLNFILDVLNRAAEKYAYTDLDGEHRSEFDRLDYPEAQIEKITIELNDGSRVHQYISGRLWVAYRGHSVVPELLQSALMALENWLVDTVENSKQETISWIYDYILRQSNSVMPTAVLASVATGYPDKVGKAAFPLLKNNEFYSLELSRTVSELSYGKLNWHGGILRDEFSELYQQERKTATERSWRQESLETLIVKFQFKQELRDEALRIVDHLKISSPSHEPARFLLHRIDSRGWTPKVDEENNRIIFEASQLEDDLKEIQQNSQLEGQINNRFSTLFLWSHQVFSKENLNREYYSSWQEALAEAKTLWSMIESGEVEANELRRSYIGGLIKSAAVFIRDFSENLSEGDIGWCIERVIPTLLSNIDSEDHMITADITDYDGAAACANVLPILFDYTSEKEERFFIKELIVKALTHNNDNVRHHAADGVREHLWSRDPEFAQMCIIGTIEYAHFDKQKFRKEYRHSYYTEDREAIRSALLAKKDEFRASFAQSLIIPSVQPISLDTHSAWHILSPCLMIPDGSREPEHIEFYSQMLAMFYASEQKDYSDRDDMNHLNYKVTTKFSERFAKYLFSLHECDFSDYIIQLNEGCNAAPDFVKHLVLYFAVKTENRQQEVVYWKLWGKLSDTMRTIAIDTAHKEQDRYGRDKRTSLLRSILKADMPWKKVNEDVQLVESGKTQLINFCRDTAINPDVFEALTKLMYYFPNLFFDQGIHILALHQKAESSLRLLSGVNTTFYLEGSIQRFLQHEQTGSLPRKIHGSCLMLLNAVVETGSAQAYSLREHLIRSRRIL